MQTRRRDFVKLAAIGIARCRPILAAPRVGRVVFCRVSAANVREAVEWLRTELGAIPEAVEGDTLRYRAFVARYEGPGRELVICGSEATLVIDGSRRWKVA